MPLSRSAHSHSRHVCLISHPTRSLRVQASNNSVQVGAGGDVQLTSAVRLLNNLETLCCGLTDTCCFALIMYEA
jgi:hypothetical protein